MLFSQVAQIVVTVIVAYLAFASIPSIAARAEDQRASLRPGYPQWVYTLVPTAQDVRIALYPAASVATVVMLLLILVYIPSATATILKYRCGVLPSLGSPFFVRYRMAVDTSVMNRRIQSTVFSA